MTPSWQDELVARLGDATELSCAFTRYWASLNAKDLIPSRGQFAPETIPDLLANLVIHELISPDFIKLRLVGTAVVDDYGQEITGRNYLDFVEEYRRPKASEAIFLICEHPCGMLVRLQSVAESGKTLTRESVAFPMRDDTGKARLIYFCSNPAVERETFFDEPDELQVMKVMERRFIDIGAGVPAFED
jgi:hypothetical protein